MRLLTNALALLPILVISVVSSVALGRVEYRDLERVKESAVELLDGSKQLNEACRKLDDAVTSEPNYSSISKLKDIHWLAKTCISESSDAKFVADKAVDKLGMALREISWKNCVSCMNSGEWSSESQFNNCKMVFGWFEEGQRLAQDAAAKYQRAADALEKARKIALELAKQN